MRRLSHYILDRAVYIENERRFLSYDYCRANVFIFMAKYSDQAFKINWLQYIYFVDYSKKFTRFRLKLLSFLFAYNYTIHSFLILSFFGVMCDKYFSANYIEYFTFF